MGLPKDTPEQVLVDRAIMDVENLLQQQTAPEDTAAIFIEPVIGEGYVGQYRETASTNTDYLSGYVPAPPPYLQALRTLCDRHGILLVAGKYIQHSCWYSADSCSDEIQTGFCRTGKMFAIEHSDVTPDLMVFAKGFANGMPISGIVTRKEILDAMSAGSLVSNVAVLGGDVC
jgi:4-aminobutyrate aminotransferase